MLRFNAYMAIKKWASMIAREVKTRHMKGSRSYETDRPLSFPKCRPKTSLFKPNDSKHGGLLFCGGEIVGEPPLIDVSKAYDKHGNEVDEDVPWIAQMHELMGDIKGEYDKGTVFFPERKDDWDHFFKEVPWNGLQSLSDGRLPEFSVVMPRDTEEATTAPSDEAADDFMKKAGLDEHGRLRLFYKNGADTAAYTPTMLWAHFGGKAVDGTSIVTRRRQAGE